MVSANEDLKYYFGFKLKLVGVHRITTSSNSFSGKGGTNKTNGGGLAPFGKTVGSLLRTPWSDKASQKKWIL
jgi:hypothetical protein